MNFSISNIAWNKDDNIKIFNTIKHYGFDGIELAPSKIFNSLPLVSDDKIDEFKHYMKPYDFQFPAMQSLLFGKSELKIFDSSRKETLKYLKIIIDIAAKLEVRVLVFGSPKNRFIGDIDKKIAYDLAINFFSQLGEYANSKDICFCIEPNAREYGCDFITNTDEAISFVKDVGIDGFRLHIDSAVMAMNHENIEKNLENALPYMEHFHISEPFLELITNNKTNHKRFSKILKDIGYDKWASIEMKNGILSSDVEAVKNSLEYISEIYGINK